MDTTLEMTNERISAAAAAMGRLGGAAGKGSPLKRKAAIKANKARWKGHKKKRK
jgi:hypothetical protein